MALSCTGLASSVMVDVSVVDTAVTTTAMEPHAEPVVTDFGHAASESPAAFGSSSSGVVLGGQGTHQPDDVSRPLVAPDPVNTANAVSHLAEHEPPGNLGSLVSAGVAEAIGIGENVSYYSTTHGKWLPAVVVGHNFFEGVLESYDLDIKRRALASRIAMGPVVHDLSRSSQECTAPAAGIPPSSGSAEVADNILLHTVPEPGEPPSCDGPDEALSAVSFSDSVESEVDIGVQNDAPSIASTEAPGVPTHQGGHGRRAPRPARPFPPPCRCDCHNAPRESLGPHRRRMRRCSCPMCGHRSVEQGNGCHMRLEVPRHFHGLVICPRCRNFCMTFLRWGDAFYDHGGVWPDRNR